MAVMDDLDATQLLALVRDIHLPTAPPVPPVWPMLLAGMLILLALTAIFFSRHRKRNTWASQARRELKAIEQSGSVHALEQTAALLKRIALTHDKNAKAMHLSGNAWLTYLDRFFNTHYFTEGEGSIFGSAIYQQNTQTPENIYRDLSRLIRRRNWQQ